MRVIIAASGEDKPGITAALSKALFDAGYNLHDTSMSVLSGCFSVMMLAEAGENATTEDLKATLAKACEPLGVHTQIWPAAGKDPNDNPAPNLFIRAFGADRPGIVYRISEALAARQINIINLETKLLHNDGGEVYCVVIECKAADDIEAETLQAEFNQLASGLHVEIEVEAIESLVL